MTIGLLRTAHYFISTRHEIGRNTLPAAVVDHLSTIFVPIATIPTSDGHAPMKVYIIPFGDDRESNRKLVRQAALHFDLPFDALPLDTINQAVDRLCGHVAVLVRHADSRYPAAIDFYRADGSLYDTAITLRDHFRRLADRIRQAAEEV